MWTRPHPRPGSSVVVKRKRKSGRGRRRRNPRTQRPARITTRRTGTGGTIQLETSEWERPPTSWDTTVLAIRVQVRKAEGIRKRQAKKRYIARAEARREAKAEGWRRKYQKPSDSLFMRLPGMAGASITPRKARVIPEETRRQAGLASRGAASTLDPQTAERILSLQAEDWTITATARELGIPRTTLGKWLSTGRVEKVAAAVGERPTL